MKSNFLSLACQKVIENLISIKVWILVSVITISSFALWDNLITAQVWSSMISGMVVTVFGLREGFKVAKIKALNEGDNKNNEDIKQIRE